MPKTFYDTGPGDQDAWTRTTGKSDLAKKGVAHWHSDKDLKEKNVALNDYDTMIHKNLRETFKEDRLRDQKKQKKVTAKKVAAASEIVTKNTDKAAFLEKQLEVVDGIRESIQEEYMTYLNKKSITAEEEALMQHLEDRIDELAQQQESMKRERTILLAEAQGVGALANKKTEALTQNIYGQHDQTLTVNKELLNNKGEKLSYTTKTGEQRMGTRISKEGKEVSLAQKSEARLNFEKRLADVGKLQEEYLAAYDTHFSRMSYGEKKWNTFLEGFGIRSKDKVRALKKERDAFRDAQTSLTEGLKRDLIEGRGFAKDQAERVAKKYVEKILTIDNVSYEQQKLLTAREKAFQEVTDKAAALEEKRKNANFLGKVAIYFKQNWELKLASKTIGATIALGSGVGAGAWLLRSLAGMAGGYMGGKWGRVLGQKIGKKLFNKEGGRQVENITEKYIEGKISITEYQKRLEQLGLRANAVAALVGTAGAIGGGMGATIVEGAAVEGANNALHSIHEYQHRDDLSPEELADAQKMLDEVREQALHDAQGGMSVEDQEKLIQNMHEEYTKSLQYQNETPETNSLPETQVTTPALQPSHDIVTAVAQKGDGYIKLTEQLQEKLRAQYPDTDHAPQAVQDFLNKKAEAFTVEEKMLVYKDGTATSGRVHPGDKLTLDPNTGRIEILSKDGHVVSILEDGKTDTTEVYSGAMGTAKGIHHEHAIIQDEAPTDNTSLDTLEGTSPRMDASTIDGVQETSAPSLDGSFVPGEEHAELDEFGNPVDIHSLDESGDNGDSGTTPTEAPQKTAVVGQEKVPAESVFEQSTKLAINTENYHPDVVAIAEKYVADLDPTQQENFLNVYTATINKIFGYTPEGEYLESGFESGSLWNAIHDGSLKNFKIAAESALGKGTPLSVPAKNLYDYLYGSSTYSDIRAIMDPSEQITIGMALALTTFDAIE